MNKACFSITGAHLTRLVRDLVLEGRYADAERVLGDVDGLSHQQHVDILRGVARFIGQTPTTPDGEGTFSLEACLDDPKSAVYRKKLYAHWKCRVYLPNQPRSAGLWTPYASVNCMTEVDARWAQAKYGTRRDLWVSKRALYYADRQDEDAVVWVGSKAVLFRTVGALPAWVPNDWLAETAQEACDGAYFRTIDARVRASSTQARAVTPVRVRRYEPVKEVDRTPEYREEISRQADAGMGWFDMDVPRPLDDTRPRRYRIPLAPWLLWCRRFTDTGIAPRHDRATIPWDNVCPSGLKMPCDSRDHSDWMVGAGLPLDAFYDDKDFAKVASKIQYDECLLITGGHVVALTPVNGTRRGVVVHAKPDEVCPPGSVVVIPHAGTDYYIPAHSGSRGGGFVITESGGALSHLSVVGIEDEIPLVLMPDARFRVPAGSAIRLDGRDGTYTLSEEDKEQP